jgi:hypothetical protein
VSDFIFEPHFKRQKQPKSTAAERELVTISHDKQYRRRRTHASVALVNLSEYRVNSGQLKQFAEIIESSIGEKGAESARLY